MSTRNFPASTPSPVRPPPDRTAGRRTGASCQAIYHLATHPPKVAELSELCGGRLFQREDDRPEAVKVWMEAGENPVVR